MAEYRVFEKLTTFVNNRADRRAYMAEIFPIVSGILIGSLLGYLRPALRLRTGALLAILFGVAATVQSGQFPVSWGFLLIDIPLVAVCAAASLWSVHKLRGPQAAR